MPLESVPSRAEGKSLSIWAARYCCWSPFLALFALAAMRLVNEQSRFFKWEVGIAISVMAAILIAGIGAGGIASAKLPWSEYKGLRLLSAIGLGVDVVFLAMTVAGAFDLQDEFRQMQHPGIVTPEAKARRAIRDMRHLEFNLEKVAHEKTNKLYNVAVAGTNLMSGALQVVSNLYNASLPLLKGHLLNMSNITSRDDLAARRESVTRYLAANEAASNYYSSMGERFDKLLVDSKLSPTEAQDVSNSFNRTLQKIQPLADIWEKNNQWGEAELEGIGLLESNWFSWKYDASQKKIIFEDNDVLAKFNQLVVSINQIRREQAVIRERWEKSSETNRIK